MDSTLIRVGSYVSDNGYYLDYGEAMCTHMLTVTTYLHHIVPSDIDLHSVYDHLTPNASLTPPLRPAHALHSSHHRLPLAARMQ